MLGGNLFNFVVLMAILDGMHDFDLGPDKLKIKCYCIWSGIVYPKLCKKWTWIRKSFRTLKRR